LAAEQELRNELAANANDAAAEIETNLDVISKTLQTAASSSILFGGIDSEEMRIMLDTTRTGIGEYSQRINYLDAKGTLLYTTEVELSDQIGSDLSDKIYYVQTRERNQPTLTGLFQALDNKTSFSVAVPVPGSSGSSFNGILAAIISAESVLNKIDQRVSLTTEDEIFLVTSEGTIIRYDGETINTEDTLDKLWIQDDIVDKNLQLMNEGRSGVFEYETLDGQSKMLAAYSPVIFSNERAWSVLITTPVYQSETFSSVIGDQRIFTIAAIVMIVIIAAIFMIFILTLNKRLHRIVQKQDVQIRAQLDDLQKAYERLTEQDKIKDEFINVAAHELRTPVLPIILSAEALAEDIDTHNGNVDIILRNAKRIGKLTNDILDVSRISSNTFRLQKDKTNIRNLIEESIQDILFKIAENKKSNLKIAFESKLPKEKEEITVDKGRLSQVLSNLLDNAVNFTEQGTITVTVEQSKDNPSFFEIRVADTGTGIDPSLRPRLFEKFATKSPKGTGLGLYLCKAIVEAHGGKIWAENNTAEGKGSIFAFTLPISN
jgi:signal transduction histidine kinase